VNLRRSTPAAQLVTGSGAADLIVACAKRGWNAIETAFKMAE